jgi:hypothetical protein
MAKAIGKLSGLEWALAQTLEQPQQPDEFTSEDFAQSTGRTIASARSLLNRMCHDGKLTKRYITVRGNKTCIFAKAS